MKQIRLQVSTAAKGDTWQPQDRFACNWGDSLKPGEWYLATVRKVLADGSCEIIYDSGDKDTYDAAYMQTKDVIKLPESFDVRYKYEYTWAEVQAVFPRPPKDHVDPIHQAVLPLLDQAEKEAKEQFNKLLKDVTAKLKTAGGDFDKVAPRTHGAHSWGRDYEEATAWRNFVYSVTVQDTKRSVDKDNKLVAVTIAKIDKTRCARVLDRFVYEAQRSFLGYVMKLKDKIGAGVTKAELHGERVWNYSILTVTKKDGSVSNWKTQVIVNVSKYGKLFNQWPTRQVS